VENPKFPHSLSHDGVKGIAAIIENNYERSWEEATTERNIQQFEPPRWLFHEMNAKSRNYVPSLKIYHVKENLMHLGKEIATARESLLT